MQNDNRLRELNDTLKSNNIHIIEIQEEQKGKGTENLFQEIISENFPTHAKRYPDPGGAGIAPQNQPKEIQTKTHSN